MDSFYTPKEVALLFRVSRQTVMRWVRKGQLPAVKITQASVRIPKQAIEAILNKAE